VSGGNNLKSDAARSNADSPFSRHSTLLGFSAVAVVASVLGWLTQWRESFVMIYIGAEASLWFCSRLFYGFRSASLIDKVTPPQGLWAWAGDLYRFGGTVAQKRTSPWRMKCGA
jgi:hypothetical protein